MVAHFVSMLDIKNILETLQCVDYGSVSEEMCRKEDAVDSIKMNESLEKQDPLL